jgi:hypothetical protein
MLMPPKSSNKHAHYLGGCHKTSVAHMGVYHGGPSNVISIEADDGKFCHA